MVKLSRPKSIAFLFCVLVLFLQVSGSYGQNDSEEEPEMTLTERQQEREKERAEEKKEEDAIDQDLGTGVHEKKDLMDTCEFAAGPRPINEVFSPGRTTYATVDDVNGGYCGVSIDSPGIWWWVEGTGKPVTVSTCHLQTDIKVKFSVFTGSCDDLECVTGGAEPDFQCDKLRQGGEKGEWNTMASAISFETKKDKNYYILVQQTEQYGRGTVWLNFREPIVPQNDNCPDAIGPVPRDMTRITNSNVDGTVSRQHDVCAVEGVRDALSVPFLYPGTWFQIMGTGNPVSIMACSKYNYDGFAFNVYHGAYCHDKNCVNGDYDLKIEDPQKCTFGSAAVVRPMTKFTFETRDRDRYWIYVHFGRTRIELPTGEFRFYVDDGSEGDDGTSGAHTIEYSIIPREDRVSDNGSDEGIEFDIISGGTLDFQQAGLSMLVLLVSSLMIQDIGDLWL